MRPETAGSCIRMLCLEVSVTVSKFGAFSLMESSAVALCTLLHRSTRTFVAAPFHRHKINTMAH